MTGSSLSSGGVSFTGTHLLRGRGRPVYIGMSEREWEEAVNIARAEQIAPEFSTKLDVR